MFTLITASRRLREAVSRVALFPRKPQSRMASGSAEALEPRMLLAAVSWVGGGATASWADPLNWSSGVVPTAADDVTIDLAGSNPTILLTSGTRAVRSLVSNENIQISGGSLNVGITAQLGQPLTLSSYASIIGGTWSGTGGISATGGTLNGVTLNCDMTIPQNATVYVENGLQVNGTLTLNAATGTALLSFDSTQTVGGTGQIIFAGAGSSGIFLRGDGTHSAQVTIGSGLTLHVNNGGSFRAYTGKDSVLNQATVLVDGAQTTLTLAGTQINAGTLRMTNGATVIVTDGFSLSGAGTFDSNGGAMQIDGTFDNSGKTLALTSATGPLTLVNYGVLKGGRITCAGSGRIIPTAGTLDGVTLGSDITVGARDRLGVKNGLTLDNATLYIATDGNGGDVSFYGTQTIGGTGQIVLDPSISDGPRYVYSRASGAPAQITLGPGITLVAQHEGSLSNFTDNDTWVNQGTIRAEGSSTILTIDGKNWVNRGRLEVRTGATLRLDGTLTTAGLGNWDGRDGTIVVWGTLDNSGATLALSATTGPLTVGGYYGTIHGGHITTSDNLQLFSSGGTLDGVTLDGNATAAHIDFGTGMTVTNGMTLNGTLTVVGGGASNLAFEGTQSILGTGQILLTSADRPLLYARGGYTITLGPDLSIRATDDASVFPYTSQDFFAIQGSIAVDGGAAFTLAPRVSVALGTNSSLSIQPGGTLRIENDLLGSTTNRSGFQALGTLDFTGGTADSPQRLEVMSHNVGAVSAGFTDNFAYGAIKLEFGNYVQLVDNSDNYPGAGAEALYVNSLEVPSTATLNLNGLHVYARVTKIGGTLLNGTVTPISGGGPIAINANSVGAISTAGQTDEWTFFGRAGRSVTVSINPGTGGDLPALSPALGYVQAQLLDAHDNIIASGSSAGSGQIVSLTAVTLPADGTYRIRVQAAAGHTSNTGNYTVALWDATTNLATLVLNQDAIGQIDSPASVNRWTFTAVAGQQVQLKLLNSSRAGLAFDLAGPNGWTGFSNNVGDSGLITLPTSGVYTLTAYGVGGAYNIAYAFRLQETAQADLALEVPYSGTFVGSGQAQLFRVEVPATTSMRIVLDDATAADHTELYAKFGAPPTRGDYQYRSAVGADQEVMVPWATAGTWYILVYGNAVRQSSDYVLSAIGSNMLVTSVSPDHLGNGEAMTLTLQGAGFDATSTVQLVSGDAVYSAAGVSHDSLAQMRATFAAGTVPPGQYAVRVTQHDGATVELPDAFTVSAGGEAKLNVNLVIPSRLGYHFADTIYVEYANTGTLAMAAPLLALDVTQNGRHGARLTLDSARATRDYWTTSQLEGFSESLEFLAMGKTPGVLLPGESVRLPVYWAGWAGQWDKTYPPFQFRVTTIYADDPQPVGWSALQEQLRPAAISQEAWEGIYSNLTSQMGGTWGSYVRMLDENASYLARLGEHVTDVASLYSFELRQSNAFDFSGPLRQTTDTSVEAPGLDIDFTRWFPSSITGRYRSGMLGIGWYTQWEMSLTRTSDGTVAIKRPDGTLRLFKPDSRGGYLAVGLGDHGQLTDLPAAGFLLRESDGTSYAFRNDGRLNYVEDNDGNRITCGYDGEQLTTLTHSAGRRLTLAYNPAGRLASITDAFDRQTLFFYDASNQHLLSVQDAQGRVTRYEYVTGQGAAAEHALSEIEQPGNTHEFFAYDAEGRLARTWRDGDAEVLTYSYDSAGTVTMTDALGGVSRVSYDNRALPLRLEDQLGSSVHLAFDAQGNLISLTDAEGRPVTYTYDSRGNVLSVTDAMGNTTRFSYGPSLNLLTSVTDANAQRTEFAHDSHGNLILQTWADGSQETWVYDSSGLPLQQSVTQGHGINYVYDADGRVTRKDYADGSHVEYAYDAHGNLASTSDASGLTSYTYDALDQLVRIDYPGGQWLAFTYDDAGRRATSNDQSSHLLTYQYDAAGRLAGLTDGAGATVVHYTFDAAGRLMRQDLANGLYTTWDYDAAGNLLQLVNHAADASAPSRFDYTYDSSGRCTSMATLAGDWSYRYDDNGQLIHAVFASRKAEIASQDLRYSYDAAGNRTQIIASNSPASYSSNVLDQYTIVGQTTYVYDANGNLIRESGPAGVTTYGYDDENRLVSVASPQGTWQLTYDALGNLVASSKDGARTQFVVDPTDLGNRVAEYSSTGELLRHYDYAAGLIRMTQGPSGFYYTADGLGSTSELIGADGTVANSYVYGPFGTVLSSTQSIANPFQWIGRWGVAQVGELSFMRARFYSASLGRFMSRDPLGLDGDGPNPYTYAGSSPLDWLDPAGTTYQNRKFAGQSFNPDYNTPSQYTQYCQEQMQFFQNMKNAWAMMDAGLSLVSPAKRQAEMLFEFFTSSAGSEDPNAKTGPGGYGSQHFVMAGSLLPYRVDFENDASATAPAQYVTITDQLDSNIDWETFSFTQFGFGDRVINVAPDSQHFETAVPVSFNGRDFEVQVRGDIDLSQGKVRVQFLSIDPTTGLPPTGMTGFLPPEDGTGRGMGYFAFNVNAKTALATGAQIHNVAQIQFDLGEIIATNQVAPHDPAQGTDPEKECLNTIDASAPTSHVTTLPATSSATPFTISWSGSDADGSGIASYNIYVSDNGAPATLWLDHTNATSAQYSGTAGHTYTFYSVATDNVGMVETPTSTAQATTRVLFPPTTAVLSGPASAVRGETLTFTCSAKGSTDPSGVAYIINWGDGSAVQKVAASAANPAGITVSHAYANAGTYNVTLTAKDSLGTASPTVTKSVAVGIVALRKDPVLARRTALFVGGTRSNDKIQFTKVGSKIAVTVNKVPQGLFAPTGRIIAYGQKGSDLIVVASDITLPAWLFGGAGNDTLTAGGGASILAGEEDNDVLTGSPGRDLLIGGAGADKLYGGTGEDVVIGGSTAFDNNLSALGSLQKEWISSPAFAQRIGHLRGGSGGLNTVFALGTATVFDDATTDILTGGADRDAFWGHVSGTSRDSLPDKTTTDNLVKT